MAILLAALSLAAASVGFEPAQADDAAWKQRFTKAHRYAVRYRRERDWLQARLTRRVLEVWALRRQVVHRTDSLEAIRLAAIAYGVDYERMVRIASCETGGSFNRYSKNPSSTASGLFQFLTGTFAGTPFGRESIWSPYANALAAGWMMGPAGRGGEWVCQ